MGSCFLLLLSPKLNNLRAAVKHGWKPGAFESIMVESQASFYDKHAPFKYAQAWSMIHFFLHGEKGRWRGLLGEYVRKLGGGASAQEAFAVTFGKEDLRAMEAAWLGHVSGLGGATVPLTRWTRRKPRGFSPGG